MTLEEIRDKKLGAVINTKTKNEALLLVKTLGVNESRFYDETDFIDVWDAFKENTCYRVVDGKVDMTDCVKYYQSINEKISEFPDLFATGGTVSIDDALEAMAANVLLDKETVFNGVSQTLKRAFDKFGKSMAENKKEDKELKFTFYVTEGTRPDKNPDGDGKGVIPTMTTEVLYKDNDGCANGGSATCDKADYNERQGCLEAIANAVLGGNFDREYEKFLADKKRKYDESCKCKICGRNYYEDEKTGKRTPFTPEDARKHEEWHEQNKKNKREKYLIRKVAKRRLAEAEREGKIEQTMKELYKK